VQLREALEAVPDLVILWVMAEGQMNERSRCFIDEGRLRGRIRFLADPGSDLIRRLGLLKEDPEAIEQGVPHPTTYLLDREGVVRFADVRRDFHVWLDARRLQREVSALPRGARPEAGRKS